MEKYLINIYGEHIVLNNLLTDLKYSKDETETAELIKEINFVKSISGGKYVTTLKEYFDLLEQILTVVDDYSIVQNGKGIVIAEDYPWWREY